MARIQAVIRDTDTPSWFTRGPSNYGEAATGSLKSDEWRSMATVYMPFALVSLWGEGSEHPSAAIAEELRLVADNSMDLFSATRLACLRTMTRERADAYRACMVRFIRNHKDLHPHVNLRPNHHAALHIFDFLHLFGPVKSWWCFPFERLIGILQRLPTNHKNGNDILSQQGVILLTVSPQANLSSPFSKPSSEAAALGGGLHGPTALPQSENSSISLMAYSSQRMTTRLWTPRIKNRRRTSPMTCRLSFRGYRQHFRHASSTTAPCIRDLQRIWAIALSSFIQRATNRHLRYLVALDISFARTGEPLLL